MGGTGREDFSTSLGCRDPQDGDKNTGIGHYDQWEGCQDKGYGDDKIAHFTPKGAGAGQTQHRKDVTQEVMDDVGTVEGQSKDEDGVSGAGDDAREVAGTHQTHTGSRVQQGAIMQRPADGSIAVIGHGSEQATFSDAKQWEEIHLGKAAGSQDGGAGGEEVGQHPGDHSHGVEYLQPGEVAQEEVHGHVQGSVGQGEEDDQQVAQQGDQVDQKHPPEQRAPEGTVTWEPQQNKFSHCCAIATSRVPKARLEGGVKGAAWQQQRLQLQQGRHVDRSTRPFQGSGVDISAPGWLTLPSGQKDRNQGSWGW